MNSIGMSFTVVLFLLGLASVRPQVFSPNGLPSENQFLLSAMENGVDITQPENTMMGQNLKEMGVEICPDKLHLCPATADCCKKDDVKWDCCPKTTADAPHTISGECCHHLGFKWTCCAPSVPKCHWFGCWWNTISKPLREDDQQCLLPNQLDHWNKGTCTSTHNLNVFLYGYGDEEADLLDENVFYSCSVFGGTWISASSSIFQMGFLLENQFSLSAMKSRVDITQPENIMMGQNLKEMGVEICPDKLHLCPATTDCCKTDVGKWDCCPKTTADAPHTISGECCHHLGFKWTCCAASVPKCHWFGCWWKFISQIEAANLLLKASSSESCLTYTTPGCLKKPSDKKSWKMFC
ncbi:uncharacterized protein CEXT_674811 [Caerostris extrusa]|uniref:Uncharacterized protein n=1 Tax=Caerostris extrusa TaxID=172846 RepID=A0AAV4SXX2_CAEEX|nr:uncharacterized protein CEXT_674811 [Caerostris extrusa]